LSLRRSLRLCAAALLLPMGLAGAQDPGPVYEAPYVPSPMSTVDEMLRLAEVGPDDVVYDLGSGDGRVVVAAAAKFGARGVGVEIDAELVGMARAAAARAGVADRVRFLRQDLFKTDLREATVVALYLAPNFNLQLRPALLALAPGTRVVSHSSGMGNWRPDRQTAIRKDVLLWIVPASIAGRWRASIGGGPSTRALELEFGQRYQDLSASAVLDGVQTHVWEARLEGARLSFVLVEGHGTEREAGLYFAGRVADGVIEGTVTRGVGRARETLPWRAER
jgi:SAM-dependent methyltransferase